MSAGFAVDPAILVAGALLLVGVLASSIASRIRIPSLLLFLGLGILIADEGLALVRFDDAVLAQNIATVALVVILFEGGLGTDPSSFRQDGSTAALLASVGVTITAGIVGLVGWILLDLEPTTAFLLGAVVSSTDAAAVFAALRTEPLPNRTRRILQLESGLNDPFAVLLTVGLIEVWRGSPDVWDWAEFLAIQLGVGLVVGLLVGVAAHTLILRLTGPAVASMGVLTLAFAAVSYGAAAVSGGSGFLAVYLTGVMLAGEHRTSRSVVSFHEGLAATAQAALFLLLGVLVFPSDLLDNTPTSIALAAALVFLARPVAVGLVLVWSRTPLRRMAVVSWAGLRGAVPVVLATIPSTAGHPDGSLIFDVTFTVVIVSVAVQGPTIGAVARRLHVESEELPAMRAEIKPIDGNGADLIELEIAAGSRVASHALNDVPLPGGAYVATIQRDDHHITPSGDTELRVGDHLLIVAPAGCGIEALERWVETLDTNG